MPTLKLGSTTALTESSGALTINGAPTITDLSNVSGTLVNSVQDNITRLGAVTSCTSIDLNSAQYVKNGKFYIIAKPEHAEYSRFKAPCDCSIIAHASQYVTQHVSGPYNGVEVRLGEAGSTTVYGYYTSSDISGQYAWKSSNAHTFSANDTVEFWTQAPYGPAYGKWWTVGLEITPTS